MNIKGNSILKKLIFYLNHLQKKLIEYLAKKIKTKDFTFYNLKDRLINSYKIFMTNIICKKIKKI